jgi:hypothetical protein
MVASGEAMQPLDLVILLKMVADNGQGSMESLCEDFQLETEVLAAALDRLDAARLYSPTSGRPNHLALTEFLSHGVRYAFPAYDEPVTKPTAGLATAWSAAPLNRSIVAGSAVVWPWEDGADVGQRTIEPLHPAALPVAAENHAFHELLALVDALRAGRARERLLARDEVARRLR